MLHEKRLLNPKPKTEEQCYEEAAAIETDAVVSVAITDSGTPMKTQSTGTAPQQQQNSTTVTVPRHN